ncbi:MAG: class I SAM-dependent methyltransferase [Promethearchaeota archaeon]
MTWIRLFLDEFLGEHGTKWNDGHRRWVKILIKRLSAISNNFLFDKSSPQKQHSKDKYDFQSELSSKERDRIQQTLKLIPKKTDIFLDVGCYDGRLTNFLTNYGTAVGIDILIDPLRYVKTNGVLSSVASMPFVENVFDCLICTEVFEHLTNIQFEKALEEILRLFPKWILVSVPLDEHLDERILFCKHCNRPFHLWGHRRVFHEDQLEKLFLDYEIVSSIKLGKIQHGFRRLNSYLIRNKQSTKASHNSCPHCGSHLAVKRGLIAKILSRINVGVRVIKMLLRKNAFDWILILYKKRMINKFL